MQSLDRSPGGDEEAGQELLPAPTTVIKDEGVQMGEFDLGAISPAGEETGATDVQVFNAGWQNLPEVRSECGPTKLKPAKGWQPPHIGRSWERVNGREREWPVIRRIPIQP